MPRTSPAPSWRCSAGAWLPPGKDWLREQLESFGPLAPGWLEHAEAWRAGTLAWSGEPRGWIQLTAEQLHLEQQGLLMAFERELLRLSAAGDRQLPVIDSSSFLSAAFSLSSRSSGLMVSVRVPTNDPSSSPPLL
jgi:hypothetical protein